MMAMGVIGLFLGAVVFAIGYELLLEWLQEGQGEPAGSAAAETAADA
jgi:predicted PurR-regulated permease PerM